MKDLTRSVCASMSPRSTIVDFDVKDRLGTKTVWCSCLRLRLKYLSRRLLYPVLAPSQGYNIERLFVTLWLPVILRSRSIDLPSVRSIPTEIDQRVSSESRDVPPDHACHSEAPFNLSAIKHTIYLFH